MPRGIPAEVVIYDVLVHGQPRRQAAKNIALAKGQRIRIRGTGRDDREALQRLNAALLRRMTGEGLQAVKAAQKAAQPRVTVEQWVKTWHQGLNPDRVSDTVRRAYLRLAEQHINPHIGRMPLNAVTRADINTLIHDTLPAKKRPDGKQRLSAGGRINAFKVLNLIMTAAQNNDLIAKNPCDGVDRPQRPWKDEQVQTLTKHARELALIYVDNPQILLMFLGIRTSEKLGLEWSCISGLNEATGATIEIKQQLARDEYGDGLYIKRRTKTKASHRTLPLVDPWLTALRKHKRQQDEWRKSPDWDPPRGMADLVFTTKSGAPISHGKDNAMWHDILESWQMPYYRRHLNRHITATLLADNNVPIDIAKSVLGHNSVAMTEFYTHAGYKRTEAPIRNLLDFAMDTGPDYETLYPHIYKNPESNADW